MRKPLAIIGMSPGNSYFKDYEVRFLLQEAIARFDRCAVMVADVPAISTYMALGYSAGKARNKAIPKGNNLKNRTRKIAEELGYTPDQVMIFDWASEIETNLEYQGYYREILTHYQTLAPFAAAVRKTSQSVLENNPRAENFSDAEIEQATHYLLSELAFMEFAPQFFVVPRVCYLYHKNWQVYEDYIQGTFDQRPRPQLDFLLLEAPYETYVKLHDQQIEDGQVLHDTLSRVTQSGILRAAYVEYPPVISRNGDEFSGIFYDVIKSFAEKVNVQIHWVEQTGYGVVIDGLASGRFDIFCSATWPTPERHKQAALSRPLYYSDVGVWVRADSRFASQDWLALNDPSARIAITEGDITHAISLTDFTRAKWIRVPQLAHVKGLLEAVAEDKADATIAERITYEAYAPGLTAKLTDIAADKPIRRYSNSFLIAKHQDDFLHILDEHIVELERDGKLARTVEHHAGPTHGLFFPI